MTHALTSRISVARACLARFCADRSANIAPIFAIALVPVVSLTGSAVDYSRANNVKAAMQAATDATALNLVQNAAKIPSGDVSATAASIFRAVFNRPDALNLLVTASSTSGGTVTVSATASVATDFMGVHRMTSIPIGSAAVAVKTPGDGSVACWRSIATRAAQSPRREARPSISTAAACTTIRTAAPP
jgi:Flp pilus assembly protein TadG